MLSERNFDLFVKLQMNWHCHINDDTLLVTSSMYVSTQQ